MKPLFHGLLVITLNFAGAQAAPLTTLPAAVSQELARQGLPDTGLGIYIQEVNAKQALLAYAADQPLNPASSIKLLTTFAALDLLGPAYTWKTEALASGPIRQGRLQGDLILKGSGDPFLTTEFFWKLLRALRDRGLQHISGGLVLDKRYFAPSPHDPGTFDGKRFRPYNAGPDALLLNFQSVGFQFLPDNHSRQIRIVPDPPPANLTIHNQLKYINGACRSVKQPISMQVNQNPSSPSVTFNGNYTGSCGELTLHRVVLKSTDLVYGVFKTLWTELGGTLAGSARVGPTPKGARLLFTLNSPPLAQLLRGVNKYSNNIMARQLLLSIGAKRYGAPGTEAKGRAAIQEWLQTQQLEFPELFLDNGSGLSRATRISARNLGRFLLMIQTHPLRPEFAASLPLAAVDGTLRRRFRGEALAARLRLKTGTIDDVRSIAGYLLSRSGKTYAVVMLHNHPGVHIGKGTQVQNALLRWLYER